MNVVNIDTLPREISRHVHFFIKLGGTTNVKVYDTKLHRSLTALKGLEILLEVTFHIIVEKNKIIERLKQHIESNYKNPIGVDADSPAMREEELSRDDNLVVDDEITDSESESVVIDSE